MFCWKRMLQRLFASSVLVRKSSTPTLSGLRHEGLKARRRKAKVTLRLEGLEERTLPSASAMPQTQMTDVTAQMSVIVQQKAQLITTVEQDLVNFWYARIHNIAQALFSVEQQWAQDLGIVPPQSGSGSGSGSGAMTTTLASSNQASRPITPQAGSGSGSGAMTTMNGSTLSQRVKPLDEPGSGSGSGGSGSVQFGSQDSLEWAPAGSGVIPWIDLSKQNKRLGDPGPTNPLVFDGSHDSAITWNGGSWASINVQNGYDAQMTVSASTNVEVLGKLVVDSKSTFHVTFGADSIFQVDGGGTITNMVLAGNPTGELLLQGGKMTIDPSPGGYTENLGATLYVNANATLYYMCYDTLQFMNDNLQIDVVGKMYTYYGSNAANTLISSNGYKNNLIFVEDGGVLYYCGNGGVTDTFTVPVFLYDGVFSLSAATEQGVTNGGKLIVQDGSGYILPNGSKESLYLEGDGSAVQLANAATLVADNGYYQVAGTLETMDTTTCTLVDNSGTTTVAGGNVTIAAANSQSYGVLNVATGNLNLNGQLNEAIAGNTGNPGTSDKLNVTGTITLQGGSGLNVTVNGQPVGGNTWIVINSGGVVNNFASMTSNPQTNLNYSPNQRQQGQYLVSF